MRYRLIIVATAVLASSPASAGSNTAPTADALVKAQVTEPLAEKDSRRSKFSRAMQPPSERRVRILDKNPQRDSVGEPFVRFAVDSRDGWDDSNDAHWNHAVITGCAYPERGQVFVKRGTAFHPATAALGKKTKPAPSLTCMPAAQVSGS